ncbi:hypothetical protein BSKO_04031 [Bryopsis sp. KO-2023]|nr:hypothetical protein BSKO_04031 [Bryopsis sp. KO-2023]
MVFNWCRRNRVLVDEDRVSKMFAEADFRREGSLSTEVLLATVLGRYPMRKYKDEWLELVDLILASSQRRQAVEGLLGIGERALQGYVETRGPELAASKYRCGSPGKRQCQDENQPANGSIRPKVEILSLESSSNAAPSPEFSGRVRFDSQLCNRGSMLEDFENAQKIESRLRRLKSKSPTTYLDLPPTPLVLPKSALMTLRTSVKTSVCRKPRFEVFHTPLRPCDATFKRNMGESEQENRDLPLNRIEPVRPTSTPFNSDYVRWTDLARRCPTAPTRWISSYPANPVF